MGSSPVAVTQTSSLKFFGNIRIKSKAPWRKVWKLEHRYQGLYETHVDPDYVYNKLAD